MKTIITIASIAAVSGAAVAGVAGSEEFRLFNNGTANSGYQVEDNGQPFFMNAQGSGNGQFAEFYVMQFDLSAYSGLGITGVEIDVTHSEPGFATTGGVSLDYTADDATALSSLNFDGSSIGGNNGQLAAADVADWTFLSGNDGSTFTYSLSDNGGLFADIQSGGIIRLILEASDPNTSATYEGFDGDFGDGGPVLRVNTIPAPSGLAILGLGGMVAARRRRA